MRSKVAIVVILTVVALAAPAFAQDDYQRANTGYGQQLGSAWLGGGEMAMIPTAATTETPVAPGGCQACGRCSSCGSAQGFACPAGPYRQTCLRCQPTCCDSAWDGYCQEKQRKLEWWAQLGTWQSPVVCIPRIRLRGGLGRCRGIGAASCGADCVAQAECTTSIEAISQSISTSPAPAIVTPQVAPENTMPESIPAAPAAEKAPGLTPPTN